jgi:hypothetical protein
VWEPVLGVAPSLGSQPGRDCQISLDAQFRCGGSEAYVEWVRRLLGLAPGGPPPWEGDPAFSVQVAGTRQELEHLLRAPGRCGIRRPDGGRILQAVE